MITQTEHLAFKADAAMDEGINELIKADKN